MYWVKYFFCSQPNPLQFPSSANLNSMQELEGLSPCLSSYAETKPTSSSMSPLNTANFAPRPLLWCVATESSLRTWRAVQVCWGVPFSVQSQAVWRIQGKWCLRYSVVGICTSQDISGVSSLCADYQYVHERQCPACPASDVDTQRWGRGSVWHIASLLHGYV